LQVRVAEQLKAQGTSLVNLDQISQLQVYSTKALGHYPAPRRAIRFSMSLGPFAVSPEPPKEAADREIEYLLDCF
jgi:hypothetical protein